MMTFLSLVRSKLMEMEVVCLERGLILVDFVDYESQELKSIGVSCGGFTMQMFRGMC